MTSPDPTVSLTLDPIDRWTIYTRLQDLSVPCECDCGQPLKVVATSPAAVLQIWSAVRSVTLPREAAITALETCWKMTVTV